jgi:hypothetical protein
VAKRNGSKWTKLTPEEKRAKRRAYYRRSVTQFAARRKKYAKSRAVWAKAYYKEYREWADELKSSVGCSVCGESRPVCLDFHHKDRETKSFSVGQGWSRNRKRLLEEIEKCTLLCANCHRALHYTSAESE